MEFEIELINGEVMVLETPKKDFKIVIDTTTGEVLHCELVSMSIHKANKCLNHAKSCYQKYINKKAIKGFMEEE